MYVLGSKSKNEIVFVFPSTKPHKSQIRIYTNIIFMKKTRYHGLPWRVCCPYLMYLSFEDSSSCRTPYQMPNQPGESRSSQAFVFYVIKGREQKRRHATVSLITTASELLEKGSVAETIVWGNVILCENVSFSSLSAVVPCAALL